MVGIVESRRAREEQLDRARINYLETCLMEGSWGEFWTFDELFQMVLCSRNSDQERIKMEGRETGLRKKLYRKSAETLITAAKRANLVLPQNKDGKKLWWFSRVRIGCAKWLIRRSYLKVWQEKEEAERHNTVESVHLRNSYYYALAIFSAKGFSAALVQIESELPKFRGRIDADPEVNHNSAIRAG